MEIFLAGMVVAAAIVVSGRQIVTELKPWESLTDSEVYDMLANGARLPLPPETPPVFQKLIRMRTNEVPGPYRWMLI